MVTVYRDFNIFYTDKHTNITIKCIQSNQINIRVNKGNNSLFMLLVCEVSGLNLQFDVV